MQTVKSNQASAGKKSENGDVMSPAKISEASPLK